MDPLPARLAHAPIANIDGIWQRHVSAAHVDTALSGRAAPGRWGTSNGYPVLYLGKPVESVIIEAYRHLIDPVSVEPGTPPPPLKPRVLLTCEVSVTDILDLRQGAGRSLAGLTLQELTSDTSDRSAYRVCQEVAATAHQLGFHGLIAPAATQRGETLAVFTDQLTTDERVDLRDQEAWFELPPDPRVERRSAHLRVVEP